MSGGCVRTHAAGTPAVGHWRVGRATVLALVGSGLPLLGHGAGPILAEFTTVAAVTATLFALSLHLASRQVSFLRLASTLVIGQMAMHGVLGLALGPPDLEHDWSHLAHAGVIGWASGAHGTAHMLAGNLLVDVCVAVLLYGWERSIWTWFRILALRLVRRVPTRVLDVVPDVPTVPLAHHVPLPRPVLLGPACGQRGPPTALPC